MKNNSVTEDIKDFFKETEVGRNELRGESAFFPRENKKETKKQSMNVGNKVPKKQSTKETNREGTNITTFEMRLNREEVIGKKRYATYLRPDTIKRIKIEALQEDKDEYEIVQRILDKHYK